MYCGRLQKKAKAGKAVGSWVMYFTLTYLPFHAGGGGEKSEIVFLEDLTGLEAAL